MGLKVVKIEGEEESGIGEEEEDFEEPIVEEEEEKEEESIVISNSQVNFHILFLF